MVGPLEILGLGALAAMGLTIMILAAIVVIAIYVYTSLALMTIAKKTKTENAWLAWIPVVNIWLIIQIAEQPWWQIFAILLYFIPVIGGIVFLAVMAFWFWKISERRSMPGWLGILMIIPIVNLIVLGILAWKD
ncbi:MAG: hypothetical protein QW041_00450 [Candidatus Pacearchaeota archaeon]